MSPRKLYDVSASDDSPMGCDRRRFVGMVGAGLAVGLLGDGATSSWAATIAAPPGSTLMPGYLRESHLVTQKENLLLAMSDFRTPLQETVRRAIPEGWPLEFVSAVDPGSAAHGFDSGRVRFWVHGLLPPGNARMVAGLESIHMEAEISNDSKSVPVRHYVWGFKENPVENLSGATTFDVAVTKDLQVRLVMSFETSGVFESGGGSQSLGGHGGESDGKPNELSTVLSLVDARNMPKLRPGVYCLPLNSAAQSAYPLVANRDWLVPDDLPYLLFSVQSLD